ncbi:MAG TPA: protein-L-isoaspartate(D-aspartate) O-methyltransferase [Chitinophagaceae bacterium]|nr:protein-L-isoaspartate(D-aspartate) O-methyltransferase [Chitinophagaceae bacterium]
MKVAKLIVVAIWLLPVQQEQDFAKRREEMVKAQIEKRGIKDAATLAALRKIPRHLFVPQNIIDDAYDDRPLPIGYGQTISQPFIVAYMTEIVKPKPDHRVLEIGTGSGYQAAVLSAIVKEVYTIEIVDSLGTQARNRLSKLNYKNITVKTGDGYHGWKEKSPFDAIVVTAAAEHIPPPLIEQLKEGGRMIIPIGSPFMVQQLMLVEKKGGKTRTSSLMPVRFVPFKRSQ